MSIRPLPPALAEKTRVELNEDPKRLKDDLQNIKDWIAKQPHLNARTDDQWLVAFLRASKFSLERTKEKLDLFYSLRSTAPELFRLKHTDPLFQEILSMGSSLILPKSPTEDVPKPRVVFMKSDTYDPKKYHVLDVLSVFHTLMKITLMDDDQAIISGTRSVVDMEGVGMSHFLQMTPITLKKMVALGQDASPIRMKGAHYLNTPTGFETIFNALKSLLNEKNKNRLYVHNKNYEDMYKYISKDIMPAEYGGNGGTLKEITEYWQNKVKEYSSWLEEDLKYGTDESKRPGAPRTSESMFGIEGSFRQLEFD